jgi:hypothetical protein
MYQNICIVIVTYTLCCNLIPFDVVGKELVFDVDAYSVDFASKNTPFFCCTC